jgi:hypothetical protein
VSGLLFLGVGGSSLTEQGSQRGSAQEVRALLEEVAAGDVLADVIEEVHERAPFREGSWVLKELDWET